MSLTTKNSFPGKFPAPKQHGAWAMFILPALIAYVLIGFLSISALLMLLGFVFVFLSYQPLTTVIKSLYKNQYVWGPAFNWSVILGLTGTIIIGLVIVYTHNWLLLLFGLFVSIALSVHLLLTARKENMSVFGEIVGVTGLTASAPMLYFAATESIAVRGWIIWLVCFLYFTGSIFYVKLKLRIQPRRNEPDFTGKLKAGKHLLFYLIIIIVFLTITTVFRNYSWFFTLAFIPFLIKAAVGVYFWQARSNLNITRFGFIELGHSIVFAVLTVLGFLNA